MDAARHIAPALNVVLDIATTLPLSILIGGLKDIETCLSCAVRLRMLKAITLLDCPFITIVMVDRPEAASQVTSLVKLSTKLVTNVSLSEFAVYKVDEPEAVVLVAVA